MTPVVSFDQVKGGLDHRAPNTNSPFFGIWIRGNVLSPKTPEKHDSKVGQKHFLTSFAILSVIASLETASTVGRRSACE